MNKTRTLTILSNLFLEIAAAGHIDEKYGSQLVSDIGREWIENPCNHNWEQDSEFNSPFNGDLLKGYYCIKCNIEKVEKVN